MDFEILSLSTRLKRTAIAFLVVLVIGTFGYCYFSPEASLFDGLYMTFVTVTTIGYSETIDISTNIPARIFTIFIAITGIGILTYAISNVAALIIESDYSKHLKKRRMEQAIQKMKDHYIICGASKLGLHIAGELEKTHRPFLLCDVKSELTTEYEEDFEYGMLLAGDATEEEFLEKLNVKAAHGMFVTTRNDHNNIVIVVTARQLSPKLRIISECLKSENQKKLEMVGADKVISPSFIGGLRMASEMVRPTVTTFLDEMLRDTNKNLRIEELSIPQKYIGQAIETLGVEELPNTLTLALREKTDWKFNPPKNYTISESSDLIVMTSPEELVQLKDKLGV